MSRPLKGRRDIFTLKEGALETASLRVSAPSIKEKRGLSIELDAAVEAMKRVPWTALEDMRGDQVTDDDDLQYLCNLTANAST
jgi:hypothetical protein